MAAQVELARGFAWIATLHAGEAWAWMQAAQPRSRIASRGARLMDLAISHPSLSVAKLNEMLAVPLDDSTARRYVRRVRPGR